MKKKSAGKIIDKTLDVFTVATLFQKANKKYLG